MRGNKNEHALLGESGKLLTRSRTQNMSREWRVWLVMYNSVFCCLSPAGGGEGLWLILYKHVSFSLHRNMYVTFYILVVRNVTHSSIGGGERNDYALLGKT